MEKITEIFNRRAAPGIILFDSLGVLRYVNPDAYELIPSLQLGREGVRKRPSCLPAELVGFVDQMMKLPLPDDPFHEPFLHTAVILTSWNIPILLRGFLLSPGNGEKGDGNHQYLVLMEMIAEDRQVDLPQARNRYALTHREAEVLKLVCNGCSNPEISAKLFISPYTVKDHIRHLKAKIGVPSRNLLVATIKNR
jgi:DNA-binding CsgD family transcriptional regulator